MSSFWRTTWILIIGAVIGGGAVEALHVVRNRRERLAQSAQTKAGREVFGQRLTCRDLAEAYAKEEASEGGSSVKVAVELQRVDFSPARNSCIASTFGGRYYRNLTLLDYAVVDLVSHEKLFEESCNETNALARDFCGNGRDMELGAERDKAFDAAIKSGQ